MTAPLELSADGPWYLSSVELQRAVGGNFAANLPKYRRAIAAATDQIDRWTGRRFLRDAVSSTRLLRANSYWRVCVGDFTDAAAVTVETDDLGDNTWSTWLSTEWRAGVDDDGLGRGVPLGGEPWRWIISTGTRAFPTSGVLDRVRVTAQWGWAAPPQPVIEACLHLACMHFDNKDHVAEQVMNIDPVTMAKDLVRGYAVEGGELFYQPLVG